MTGEEFFFQTWNQNYDTPPDTNTSGASTSAPTTPLTISNMPIEPLPKMAKGQPDGQETIPRRPITIALWMI